MERMRFFERDLLDSFAAVPCEVMAWALLPNHYHVLALTTDARSVLNALGRLHGRTSHQWNGEDNSRGRKTWFNAVETGIKSDGHYWASVNYIHHNPVKHGYVKKWLDWPFSSARQWLEKLGRDKMEDLWKSYPVGDYGKGWDD